MYIFKKLTKLFFLLSITFLTACTTSSRKDIAAERHLSTGQAYNSSSNELSTAAESVAIDNSISENAGEGLPADNADIMTEILAEDADNISSPPLSESRYGEIKLPVNKYVKVWINYFTGRGRDHMRRYLSRSSKYIPKMKKILMKEGLPEDLVYLPVIESGFYTRAKSFKGATGYWQFMPGSGRDYGLKINHLVDDRKDYVKSTEAAARYLKKLYKMFGDWNLALSAYNAGQNRVKKQIAKAKTRNYWQLVKNKGLYKETREYVPKFIAATLIAKNPVNYGFTSVPYQDEHTYSSMYVSKPMNLKKLATKMKISFKSLKKLNPRYRTHKVPVYRSGPSLVRVPKGKLAKAHRAAKTSYTTISKRVYRPLRITRYKVKRGDNLTKIARKFGVSVSKLRKTNSLRRRSVLFVGKRLKIVRSGPQAQPKKRSISSTRSVSAKVSKNYRKIKKTHKVTRGENLSLIAKRYKVSLSKLLKYNNMKLSKKLYVGQKIKLIPSAVAKSKRRVRKNKVVTYKVKAGDNLQKISKRFGTSVSKLKASNGLRSSKINTGKRLQIAADNIKLHIVKRGESLIAIANKYKVSMSNILYANDLKNKSKIRIGSRLTIPLASNN